MKATNRPTRANQRKNTKGFNVKTSIRAGRRDQFGYNRRDSYGAEYGTF